MKIVNVEDLPVEFEAIYRDGSQTKMLGDAAGSDKLYVNMDILMPGTYGSKYHAHTEQEEFFIIVEGNGIIRCEDGEHEVKAGDCISKRCGREYSHQFYNDGTVPLKILDIGLRVMSDICIYPDEDAFLVKCLGMAFGKKDCLSEWTSDPVK